MKLYATVKSERASKGQGGNKFIRVELRQKEGNPIEYYIDYNEKCILVMDSTYGVLLETGKGNKQKTANSDCKCIWAVREKDCKAVHHHC